MAHVTTYMGFTIPLLLRSACRLCPAHSALVVLRHSASCYCTVNGTAQSKRKMDHLERTANNFRQEVISQAKVCGITSESETVKRLRLAVTNKDFTFKAGQWVDFFIPGVSVIGGFSMCSSPGLLEREGVLELAVKYADHPPARWIHTEKNILGLMSALPGKISCRFHVTQQNSPICEELQPHVTEGRISEKDLEKHVSKDTLWYICGPPPMIESISQLLYNSGVHRNCVFFEKWW
ncbi:oxidoreductase NAD-binding domain-containing protein 1 isoform X3 [Centrocercus urophasianus]|uniref:oxidoreductase NAD-binding domain-containing protein 1 isoform X3 n=1 Tax=Centrocercus urophasianus TaxID=9002 RepID=UPI001C646F0E|nr:oxidoreductase NAD-binding domain-containing protein 1 isoform X3 [Centrocercus urophasianus]